MANLTQQEFLDIADLYPEGINIWCTESTPITVLGVSVPLTDNEGNSIGNTLEQVQTITLPVDNDPGTTIELQINSRASPLWLAECFNTSLAMESKPASKVMAERYQDPFPRKPAMCLPVKTWGLRKGGRRRNLALR